MHRSRLLAFLDWSFQVGRLFEIPIRLHISLIFFLFPLLRGRGLDAWHTLEYIVLIVLSILLHELGHALTAKRYRLTQLTIMLHGFGGFAASSGYRTPKQDLIITLAGPAVTFAIGIICTLIGHFGENTFAYGTEASMQIFLIGSIGKINILLGCLNLLPSFPFDGGNALKAILTPKYGDFKSMRLVGHLGLVLSSILAVYGLFSDQGILTIFGLMGLISSVSFLLSSGGIKLGEAFADRKHRKEMEAIKSKEAERRKVYLSDVHSRSKEREEKERLRKILEASLDE